MEFRLQPLGFMDFFQNNNHQAVKKMKWIENRKNAVKNRCGFVWIFTCGCKCVCVCVYACVCMHVCACIGYSCVLMCICTSLSEFANAVCFIRGY